MVLSFLLPKIARHNTTSAARTSFLLTPLLLHKTRTTVSIHSKNETSKHKRRTMIIVGDRFSFRAKNVARFRMPSTPRDRGLRTMDHIPRSSMSHSVWPRLSAGLPLPAPPRMGEAPPLNETLDLGGCAARPSKDSSLSLRAARWA